MSRWLPFKSVLFSALVVILILIAAHPQPAYAAPLSDVPVTVTQPDGQVLNLFASGDEYYNWLHDERGYTILQHPSTGYYVFADLVDGVLVPTLHVVGRVNPALVGLVPGLNFPAQTIGALRLAARDRMQQGAPVYPDAPTIGTIANLVIFVRFSGEAEFTNPLANYTNMFDSSTAGVNSMRNYFQEASYTALTVGSNFYPTPSGSVISYQDGNPRAITSPTTLPPTPGAMSTTPIEPFVSTPCCAMRSTMSTAWDSSLPAR